MTYIYSCIISILDLCTVFMMWVYTVITHCRSDWPIYPIAHYDSLSNCWLDTLGYCAILLLHILAYQKTVWSIKSGHHYTYRPFLHWILGKSIMYVLKYDCSINCTLSPFTHACVCVCARVCRVVRQAIAKGKGLVRSTIFKCWKRRNLLNEQCISLSWHWLTGFWDVMSSPHIISMKVPLHNGHHVYW